MIGFLIDGKVRRSLKHTDEIVSARWPNGLGNDRLLLVDGHAYAYRAFYAIRGLVDQDGNPTNAIFGFIKMLRKLEQMIRPSHLAVIWDGGLSEDRLELLPEYKAQRPSMPDDLARQIEAISQYLDPAGIKSLVQDGLEADDWIAVAARQAASAGMQVVVASADKDFFQLVSDQIGILNPNDKVPCIWDETSVVAKTGVLPAQIVDWLALLGDSVDNIKGINGVGPKTARDLLNKFGSLEGIKAGMASLGNGKIAKAVVESADVLERNQQLVRLPDRIYVQFDVRDWVRRSPDVDTLKRMYEQWRFKSLFNELNEVAQRTLF